MQHARNTVQSEISFSGLVALAPLAAIMAVKHHLLRCKLGGLHDLLASIDARLAADSLVGTEYGDELTVRRRTIKEAISEMEAAIKAAVAAEAA